MEALTLAALGLTPLQPPAWIQRAVPPPIVTWREADVLGQGKPTDCGTSLP